MGVILVSELHLGSTGLDGVYKPFTRAREIWSKSPMPVFVPFKFPERFAGVLKVHGQTSQQRASERARAMAKSVQADYFMPVGSLTFKVLARYIFKEMAKTLNNLQSIS